jgi:hypothetical protein
MAIRERLLSPQSSSRPKQDRQNNCPNNTPADPCDVRVSRLPFENLLMNGHQECPSLSSTGILQIVASFCQIFSAAAAMPVTCRRKDHYRKFSSSCALAARVARSQTIFDRAEVLAAALARDLDRCAAIQAVIAREIALPTVKHSSSFGSVLI